jgi:hypothetical protein
MVLDVTQNLAFRTIPGPLIYIAYLLGYFTGLAAGSRLRDTVSNAQELSAHARRAIIWRGRRAVRGEIGGNLRIVFNNCCPSKRLSTGRQADGFYHLDLLTVSKRAKHRSRHSRKLGFTP